MAKKIELGKMFFTVEHKLCEDVWSAVFSINATDENDAANKANRWARYHSFDSRDIRVRVSTPHEAEHWLHNEYVK